MNYIYLTDGPSRHIAIANGRGITFKRVAPRNLSFKNCPAMLVTSALKTIMRENVTDEQVKHISSILQNEDKEAVMGDIALMPAWIRNIVRNAYL